MRRGRRPPAHPSWYWLDGVRPFEKIEKLPRRDNPDPSLAAKRKQVLVASDDVVRTRPEGRMR